MQFDAVIVAAGSSSRFGEADKLTANLVSRPVLAWSMVAVEQAAGVQNIVVVTTGDRVEAVRDLGDEWCPNARLSVITGGVRRRDSVEAGLRRCVATYVAIHDGARPLTSSKLIESVVIAADGKPGAIAACPVTDTIKKVADGLVVGHPDRSRLWAAQTPQVVLRQAWLDAAAMSDNDETDDAAMLARLGLECAVVDAGPENIKITRPHDLEVVPVHVIDR